MRVKMLSESKKTGAKAVKEKGGKKEICLNI